MNRKFLKQNTLKREVWCGGVGLHSGAGVSLRMLPAPPDFGIRFKRVDLGHRPEIPAHYEQVVDTFLATTLGRDGVVVSTVEHLMAALFCCGVDNVLIEVDGPEVPILDGSAAPFVEVIRKAGLREQGAVRQCLVVEKPLEVREGDAYIKARPSRDFRVHYAIDFPHPLVGRQEYAWSLGAGTFAVEIAGARTFGFLKDVQKLQSIGLAQGGSLANAIVFDDRGLLNKDGLRYSDECVRHKVLDFVGDLALAGGSVRGSFEVRKAGHALHNAFLRKLTESPGYCAVAPTTVQVPFFHAPGMSPLGMKYSSVGKPV